MNYFSKARELINYGLGVRADHVATCSICGKNPAQILFNEHPMFRVNQVFPCVSCNKEPESAERDWYEKNPTSVWKSPEGKEVAMDQRGKVMMDNPYEGRHRAVDPHGWMKTDKKKFKRHLEKKGIV